MPKLIKKYQVGSVFTPPEVTNPYSTAKKPYTGNALGIDWQSLSEKDLVRFKNAIADPITGPDPVYKSLYGNQATLVQNNFDNLNMDNIDDSVESGASNFNGTMNTIADIGSTVSKLLPSDVSSLTKSYNQMYDTVSNALSATPVGWIMKIGGIGSEIGYALGHKTDQVTKEDQFLDSYFGRVTPGGWQNLASRGKVNKLLPGFNDMMPMIGSGYGGLLSQYEKVKDVTGKVVGNAWGLKTRANRRVNRLNSLLAILLGIYDKAKQNQDLVSLMQDRWSERAMTDMNGGFGNIYFGRHGVKLDLSKLKKVHEILNQPKVLDTLTEFEEVQEFKEGGKMNVIPEGALHARLHHMENAEGLTKKGIPVVSIAEGGELELLAEIELNEIIFNLEVTQKLEKLMEDGSDNAAIEAGKLLVKEIFENTDDRTGLIDKLTGGELPPEEAVKNHQVFQYGGSIPTLKNIEELVDYAIKKNPYFVKRIGPDMGYAEFQDETGKRQRGTHLLGYTSDNGKFVVYPLILMQEGRLQYNPDWKDAYNKAKEEGNILEFDSEDEAKKFTKEYKKSRQWKPYFDMWEQRFGSYKYGGIIEKLDTLSEEELLDLRKYLKLEEA